jgi:hypothetical protein
MRESRALTRPRRWKETLGAATLGVVVVATALVAPVTLQVATLPRPSRSELVAVQVERWLVRHPAVESTAKLAGRRVTSTCVGSWVGPVPLLPRRVRASLMVTSEHQDLLGERGDVFRGNVRLREDETMRAYDAVELAGCPWWLGSRLGNVLQRRAPLVVTAAKIDGRRAYRVRFGRDPGGVELDVARGTSAPIAVHVDGRFGGWARLRPGSYADVRRVERFFRAVARPGRSAL